MKADQSPFREITSISTGLPNLDKITGLGGIPRRRITEISGPYSVGKTSLAFSIIAQAQKMGLRCLFVDIEWAFDEAYAERLGVDTSELEFIQERYAEKSLDEIELQLEEKAVDLVVLDSVGGLLPRAEAEKGAEGKVIGAQAKLVSTFCRKVVPLLAINNVALVVVNHEFIDLMHGNLKTSGGAKLEYHKSLWIKLSRGQKKITKGEVQTGQEIIAEIRKNKLASTQKQKCALTMIYGSGFSAEADMLAQMLESGEVEKRGNSYFRGETKLGTGLNQAREALRLLP